MGEKEYKKISKKYRDRYYVDKVNVIQIKKCKAQKKL